MIEQKTLLNDLEKDALREIINMAFGDAAVSLSEIINVYCFLNVPRVEILQPDEITACIDKELSRVKDLSIVEQYYIGTIKGAAFLVFSYDSGRQLLSLFGDENVLGMDGYDIDFLEKETLMEVANIIIGVCVSRLSELLEGTVMYMPPRFLGGQYSSDDFSKDIFDAESYVILLKTVFQFDNRDINGYLFLVNSYESINWLKKAIDDFIEHYS